MPAAIARPPSYIPVSQSELGSFQQFLEKPGPSKEKVKRGGSELQQPEEWNRLTWQVLEIFLAELVGTALLLFFGCMSQVSWTPSQPLPPLQGAIVFGLAVATIVQIFGHISAAHINPAVTIGFAVLGKVTPAMALVYIMAECAGAILGYGLLILLTPADLMSPVGSSIGLCCTVPQDQLTDFQAVAMEFFATFFLVMVVCASTDSRNANKTDSLPLKFGCVIFTLAVAVGPYTGGSMNPARSLGPAFWTGTWKSHWVYWLGPCLSGLFSAIFYRAIFNIENIENTPNEVSLTQVQINGQKINGNQQNH